LSCIGRSRRPLSGCRAGRFCAWQQSIQIDRSLSRAIFETESDLRVVQARLSRGTIRRANALAKDVFHRLAQIASHAVQMPRNAGFVFAQHPSNLRERFFFGVIKAKPLLLLWFKALERRLQGARE